MTIYYIIWFVFFFCLWSLYLCFYLSLCLCPVSLFLTLTQSHYRYYEFIMHYQQNFFLTLPFFSITCSYYCPTTSQQTIKYSLSLSLSLSIYIYIKYKRESQAQSDRESQCPKKKKNHHRHRFNSQSPT